jgi:succinylarginine dihydrolase
MPHAVEVNFDGIVGPTHNYSGLAAGNIASMRNRGRKSNPKSAALQGLKKMRLLMELGVPQAVLPPHERPHIGFLKALGFSGSDTAIIAAAAKHNPLMLANCSSASAMWAANAATVSPSADARDGKVHVTPANLLSELHRSLEPAAHTRMLRAIFADEQYFAVHDPLPAAWAMRDEGAANHLRLAPAHGSRGIEIFTFDSPTPYQPLEAPRHFPARQSLGAGIAVRHLHQIRGEHAFCIQRTAECVDAGAFHADLVAMSNQDVLIYHQQAFDRAGLAVIRRAYYKLTGQYPRLAEIAEDNLSLADAVQTYFFNSQLLTLPDGSMLLIAPMECQSHPAARAQVELLMRQGLFQRVEFVNVRQSMRNGGGPACLRLRVVLTKNQLAAMHQGVLLTPKLYNQLTAWVEKHYRDELTPADLADPHLLRESRRALDSLTNILQLGPLCDFQR